MTQSSQRRVSRLIRLTQIEQAAIALRDDMLMRTEKRYHLNGTKVAIPADVSVWSRFCRALGDEE